MCVVVSVELLLSWIYCHSGHMHVYVVAACGTVVVVESLLSWNYACAG